MLRTCSIVAAVAVLVAAGVVAGIHTNRFGVHADLRIAAERLKAVPKTVGPWVVAHEFDMDPKIQQRAEAVEYVSRLYENRDTHARVTVLLLCGESGPIGSHSPEVCYGGLGYETNVRKDVQSVSLPGGGTARYFSARFEKPTGPERILRVCWAWGREGDWFASEAARRDFALHSVLYKLYVSREITAAEPETGSTNDPIQEFLAVFLPEVKKSLAPH